MHSDATAILVQLNSTKCTCSFVQGLSLLYQALAPYECPVFCMMTMTGKGSRKQGSEEGNEAQESKEGCLS